MGFLDADIVKAREAQKSTKSAIDNMALISGPAPVTKAPAPSTTSVQSAIDNMALIYGEAPPVTGTAPVSAAPAPTTAAAPVGTNDVPVPVSEPRDQAVVQAADPSGGFNDQLAKFTEQDISAALAAIEAEFGLTREELLRDQTMIGAQYRLLTAQLVRQREKALGQAEAGALQRGLFRSGIYAAEAGEVATTFADKQAEFQTAADSQQLAIQQRLAALDAEKEQVKAQEETAIRRGEYTARLQAAGL